MILDGGIAQADKMALDKLREIRNFSVNYYPVNSKGDYGVFDARGLSVATYYRLRIGDFLPDISRTLYLDTDMTVLCSLRELFNADLGAYVFGACLDGAHEAHARRLGVPDGSYFNAGMMLMDLDKWRKGGIYAKCAATAQKYAEKISYHDQDILNLIFRGHYRILPQTWNMLSFVVNGHALARAKVQKTSGQTDIDIPRHNILHFAGPGKLEAPAGAVLSKYAQIAGFSLQDVLAAWEPEFLDKIQNRNK